MWDAFPSALDLARFQFAFTVSFHFLFPAFTIGLASFLAVLEGLWLWTGRQAYLDLFRYWLKIFAVAFAMGVVSGIVMSYQFGTNWSVFSDRTAPVLGPIMAYEVLTAFFLEAGFLGVMLFGLERVGKKLHFAATALVAVGTLISGFWILSANSWMHTPAGHSIAPDGRFMPEDWWAIVFNPSFPLRYLHTINGAYLTTALVVGAVSAFYLLRERRRGDQPGDVTERVRIGFSMAMWLVLVAAPTQAVLGDLQGSVAYKYQPAKVAAMEGHFETHRGAPLVLFGIPNVKERRNDLEIAIPNVASLYLTHSWDGEVVGLNDLPPETHPTNVPLVFFSFRVMVGLGLLMIALAATGLVLRLRGRLFGTGWFLRWAVAMGPAGSVAVIAGWIVTEAGRQPFTVYGLLRTADSVSPISAPAVAASLLAFVVVYFLVFGAGTWYLFRLFGQPPHVHEAGPEKGRPVRTAGITPGHAVDPDRMGGGGRSGAPVPAAPAE